MKQILLTKLEKYRRWSSLQEGEKPFHTSVKERTAVPYILAALEKIEKGTFGVCEDCSGQINEKRLSTVPGAIRCTECQSEFESFHRSQR